MDQALAQLIDMGYSIEQSTKALQANGHDFDKALDWLFKHPTSSPKPPSHAPPQPPKKHHQFPYNNNHHQHHNKKNINNNKYHRRIESLLNMGFERNQCLFALKLKKNNVEQAIEYLLTHNPNKEDDDKDNEFVFINDEDKEKKNDDWEEITFSDLSNHHISPWDMELQNEYECGSILSSYKLRELITKCPTRTHLYKWKLFYSTENDGLSINTLYDNLCSVEESMLIISDTNKNVFGAFIDCKWVKPSKQIKEKGGKIKYSGTVDCFVFNYFINNNIKDNDKKQLKIYKATGVARYYFRNDKRSITIGSGESPAIYFDYDFNFGRSVFCDTFNSPPLSSNTQFKIQKIEVWAPNYSIQND